MDTHYNTLTINFTVNDECKLTVTNNDPIAKFSSTLRNMFEDFKDPDTGTYSSDKMDVPLTFNKCDQVTTLHITKMLDWCEHYKNYNNGNVERIKIKNKFNEMVVEGDNEYEYDETKIKDHREQLNNEWNKEWFERGVNYGITPVNYDDLPDDSIVNWYKEWYKSLPSDKKQEYYRLRVLMQHLNVFSILADFLDVETMFVLTSKKQADMLNTLVPRHDMTDDEMDTYIPIVRYILAAPKDLTNEQVATIRQQIRDRVFGKKNTD